MENRINVETEETVEWKPSDEKIQPLEYSVGEICNCYYNEVGRPQSGNVSQSILKCHSFCKVLERNSDDRKEYLVRLFNPVGDESNRRVPGCCLRKTKVLPYTFFEACRNIGKIAVSKDGDDAMMLVSVSKDGDNVRINDIPSKTLMEDFTFENGSPCGTIVMLKADEAFGNRQQ